MGIYETLGFWVVWGVTGVSAWVLGWAKNRPLSGFWLGVIYGPLGLFGAIVMADGPVPRMAASKKDDRCYESVTDFDKDIDKAIEGK